MHVYVYRYVVTQWGGGHWYVVMHVYVYRYVVTQGGVGWYVVIHVYVCWHEFIHVCLSVCCYTGGVY